jgi:hypothetical protein
MTNEHTPETDAMFADNVPEDAQIVAFCERLESERNAARAERDDAAALARNYAERMLRSDAELAEARADVARLRDVLQRIVSNGGSATNEMLFDARTDLAK